MQAATFHLDNKLLCLPNMAVIGSSMGMPSVSDLLSSGLLRILLVSLLVSSVGWLIIDYVRMLRLRAKMVRSSPLQRCSSPQH